MQEHAQRRSSPQSPRSAQATAPALAAHDNGLAREQLAAAGRGEEEDSDLLDGLDGLDGLDAPQLQVPLRDVIYEQLAHRTSYLHFPARLLQKDGLLPKVTKRDEHAFEFDEHENEWVESLGYAVEEVIDDPQTGFQAVLFVPSVDGVWIKEGDRLYQSTEGLRPVVAFRGSQSNASWDEDTNAEGAGSMQFRLNEAGILKLLAKGAAGGATPDVTGHSLGGGLAQMAAAHYPGSVGDVVTFQSVGLSKTDAKYGRHADNDATHYRVAHDAVPLGGTQQIGDASDIVNLKLDDVGAGNLTDSHCEFPVGKLHDKAASRGDRHLHMLASAEKTTGYHDADYATGLHLPGKAVKNSGLGEGVRKSGIMVRHDWSAKGYLGAPIVRLSEELRSRVYEWRKKGLRGAALHAEIRRYVVAQERSLCRSAWYAAYLGTELTISDELVATCRSLSARLIEETCELADMQDAGTIDRIGWDLSFGATVPR